MTDKATNTGQNFDFNQLRTRLADQIERRFGGGGSGTGSPSSDKSNVQEIVNWVRSLNETELMAGSAGYSGTPGNYGKSTT